MNIYLDLTDIENTESNNKKDVCWEWENNRYGTLNAVIGFISASAKVLDRLFLFVVTNFD